MFTEPGLEYLEAMEGESYNMCHFWSNFERARLDWFRSKPYDDFFNMMDRSGVLWIERVVASSLSSISFYVANQTSVRRYTYSFTCRRRLFVSRRHPLLEISAIDIQQYSIA